MKRNLPDSRRHSLCAPFSAIAAGLIADRFSPSKSILVFIVLSLTYLFPATSVPNQNHWLFISTVAVSGAGVFVTGNLFRYP